MKIGNTIWKENGTKLFFWGWSDGSRGTVLAELCEAPVQAVRCSTLKGSQTDETQKPCSQINWQTQQKNQGVGQRDGSAVKSTGYFSRRLGFKSLHPQ